MKTIAKTLFAALLLLAVVPLHAAQVTVSQPKWWAEGKVTAVAFDLSAKTEYSLFTLDNPNRLVVDFRNARYNGDNNLRVANHHLIRKIRHGARDGGRHRIVLDLSAKVTVASYLANGGKRLVVELAGESAPVVTRQARIATPKAAPKIASKPASPKPAPRPASKQPPKEDSGFSLVGIFSDDNRIQRKSTLPPTKGRDVVVVIDAGHGGYDVGAQGRHGTNEKDVALGIAKQLASLIDREEGMRAILTRKGDYFIKLRDRMQIARDANADLFVSVHANAYKNDLAKGASIYILSPRGASSEAARLLAEKENSAESIGTIELHDKDEDLRAVLVDLSQSATIQESHDVAARVLKRMGGLGRIHMRTVQKAGFAVLKSPDVPSILVETAFITNPDEERKLRSLEHQQGYAKAILGGARDYFYTNPPPGTIIAAKVSRDRTLAGLSDGRTLVPES